LKVINFGQMIANAVVDLGALGTPKMRIATGGICAVIGGGIGYFLADPDIPFQTYEMVVWGVLLGGGLGALFTSVVLGCLILAVIFGLWLAATSIWGT
jgi:hypothetical protein